MGKEILFNSYPSNEEKSRNSKPLVKCNQEDDANVESHENHKQK